MFPLLLIHFGCVFSWMNEKEGVHCTTWVSFFSRSPWKTTYFLTRRLPPHLLFWKCIKGGGMYFFSAQGDGNSILENRGKYGNIWENMGTSWTKTHVLRKVSHFQTDRPDSHWIAFDFRMQPKEHRQCWPQQVLLGVRFTSRRTAVDSPGPDVQCTTASKPLCPSHHSSYSAICIFFSRCLGNLTKYVT